MDVGMKEVESILLVEDNPGDIRLIEEAFEASPLDPTIHPTKTGDEALDLLLQRGEYEDVPRPDLVLLDWKLSQYTGEEVIEAAKSGNSSIPVVVMLGSQSGLERVESSAPEADEYIEKQTDLQAYIEILRSCGIEQ